MIDTQLMFETVLRRGLVLCENRQPFFRNGALRLRRFEVFDASGELLSSERSSAVAIETAHAELVKEFEDEHD